MTQPTCNQLEPDDPAARPDLQIEATQPLGNGDPIVDCRTALPPLQWGGVAPVVPPDFGPSQSITDALQDFACRFTAFTSSTPCTLDRNGNSSVVSQGATVQFCDQIATNAQLPLGETVLTAQVADVSRNIGPTAQVVIRVVTPTPLH